MEIVEFADITLVETKEPDKTNTTMVDSLAGKMTAKVNGGY